MFIFSKYLYIGYGNTTKYVQYLIWDDCSLKSVRILQNLPSLTTQTRQWLRGHLTANFEGLSLNLKEIIGQTKYLCVCSRLYADKRFSNFVIEYHLENEKVRETVLDGSCGAQLLYRVCWAKNLEVENLVSLSFQCTVFKMLLVDENLSKIRSKI